MPQPATHAGLEVPIGVAEPPFQVRLLARDDAVADRDCQRQREDQGPRASCGYADAAVDEKHAEIDGIAGPAVNASRHQRAGGLVPYRRRSAGEVADSRGCERKTDEDQGAGDDPVDQDGLRNGERQRQQVIRGETEQKSGEKEEGRSRDDLPFRCRSLVAQPGPYTCMLPADAGGLRGRNSSLRMTPMVSFCHLTTKVSTREAGKAKGNGGDGVGTTQDRGGPK